MKRSRLPDSEGEDLQPEKDIPQTTTANLTGGEHPRISNKDKLTRATTPKDDWNDWSDSEEDYDLIPNFSDIGAFY